MKAFREWLIVGLLAVLVAVSLFGSVTLARLSTDENPPEEKIGKVVRRHPAALHQKVFKQEVPPKLMKPRRMSIDLNEFWPKPIKPTEFPPFNLRGD
jgi:hypothetical protein